MNLARALAAIQADDTISALGIVHDGKAHYVSLAPTRVGVEVVSSILPHHPLRAPFDVGGMDESQKLVLAKLARETDWTLFRGGMPLDDEQAPARPKRARRARHG